MRIIRACLFGLSVIGALPSGGQAAERDINPTEKASAAEVAITGEYWALLIGIDTYQHVESLETAVRDVQAVRDVLVQRYGFAPGRISMLVNRQATRAAIEDTLYEIGQKTKPEDSVLIYYAGHGQTDPEKLRGWWVPVDGKAKSPGTFISNARVRDEMAAMKARHVYLVADSCFSGSLFGRTRAMPPLSDKIVARLYQDRSRWGLTSGMNEPVSDSGKGGHSIFAYFFLKLLRENQDPYLIPLQIYDRLLPLVANNSRQQPRSQPLQDAHDEGGQFVFRLTLHTKGGAAARLAASPAAEPPKPIQEARLRPETELPDPVALRKTQLQVIFDQALRVEKENDCCHDIGLQSIAEVQAKAGDLEGALKTRAAIKNNEYKNDHDLMMAIIVAKAKAGQIQEAIQQATDLKNSPYGGYESTLLAIADAQVRAGDTAGAMKTVSLDDKELQKNLQASVLLKQAKRQLKRGDKTAARQTIQEALNSSTVSYSQDVEPVELLLDMGDITGALQAATRLQQSSLPYWYFSAAIAKVARYRARMGDIEGAFQIAYQVREDFRSTPLGAIAVIQAQRGDTFGSMRTFQDAIKLARATGGVPGIFDAQTHRELNLGYIAWDRAKAGDVDGAMETASLVLKDQRKVAVFAGIGREQRDTGDKIGAARTFAHAVRVAEGISDKYRRQDALKDIVLAQINAGDLMGALMTASHPALEGERIVYMMVVEAYSKAGDVQGALDLASSQKKPDDKVSVLLSAARGLIKADGDE